MIHFLNTQQFFKNPFDQFNNITPRVEKIKILILGNLSQDSNSSPLDIAAHTVALCHRDRSISTDLAVKAIGTDLYEAW